MTIDLYRSVLRPLLFRLDAETAHHLGERALAAGFPWGLYGDRLFVPDPRLRVEVAGLSFANPVGLAPGFDKNARTIPALQQLGFGYVVVGGILPHPRPGNPRPRVLRYVEKESLINCYGLPSDGLEACAARLRRVRTDTTRVLANMDAFTVDEYVRSFETLQPLVDAMEVHTMCPNNRDDRGEFLRRGQFEQMLQAIAPRKRKPLFVKLLPWENETEHQERLGMVELGLHYGVDGYTIPGTWNLPEPRLSIGRGHISGRMAFPRTLEIVRELAEVTRGRAAIKALGGIASGEDAFQAIAAGATLVELLSAFVYEGWTVVRRINQELAALMAARGFPSVAALRGSAAGRQTADGRRQ
ncbi:MAG: dihydroorotate dehydrogenase 2 [Chloroflexi bacterium]|nr:dihydroorotate dehydrogenase 2 [Chloroflexota bacterium]